MAFTKRPGFQRETTGSGIVSDENSSAVALGSAGVFTGSWVDTLGYPDTIVAVKADQDGSFQVQYSPDGTNVDSTLTRYYRTDLIEAPHRYTNTRRYMRVVYTNGSTTQTVFRLQTSLGDFHSLNAPSDGTLANDFDAIAVRPSHYYDEVALGRRQGSTQWHKWGYNTDVDTAAEETIWEPGGNPTFLTTASTIDIVSADANDVDAGTGAHGVVLYGIDANRKSQVEVVLLNGTSSVQSTGSFLGLNRVALYRAGSGMVNAGKLTITATTGGSTQATIPAGEGTTQQAFFFTQAGHQFLARDLAITVGKTSGGSSPTVTIKGWVQSFVSNAKYEVFRTIIDTSDSEHFLYHPDNSFPVGEQSVLFFTADTDTNNTEVQLRFSGIEVRNAST